ncbi:hypothetical protein A9Q84_19330 [Halobacteriovorax marinus]|uniref:Uncharacterized protein n=1 Tax=Halobacteriovorax marinus TaxID=97084 RepID=A0A1Y5F313_9BACT|nr:hypothetical protein A9Q84_19330 [Halobacteriovorax marinus]
MKLYPLLSKLPYFIQTLPYFIAKVVVTTLIAKKDVKIWVRNSYVFNNIVCALSDLDFTIVVKEVVMGDKAVARYSLLKKVFPFLGEINLYLEDELKTFAPIVNSFELKRDPSLMEYLGNQVVSSTKYEELVFLCKTVESDQENLLSIPEYRVKKWQHHFELTGNQCDVSLSSLLNLLKEKSQSLGFDSDKFIEHYYTKNRTIKKDCDDFYRENLDKQSYILLYPFRWIGSSLTCDSFIHDIEEIKSFSEDQLKLLEAQVQWEVWGLYSQHIHNLRQATLHTHLENIREMMEVSEYLRNSKAYELLNKLRALHENLLIHYPKSGKL